MLRIVMLVVLMMGLTGCFLDPGMRMNMPVSVRSTASQIKPTFIPITISLIDKLCETKQDTTSMDYSYHVGARDVLNINVWGHPELSVPVGQTVGEQGGNASLTASMAAGGYLVDPTGYIFFPLIGQVRVIGRTTNEIRTQITMALGKYVRNPQIDVRVIGFRSEKVYVMGEVLKPGIQPITDMPMNITDVINLSGGLDPLSADPKHIFVIRGKYAQPTVYWLNARSPEALLLAERFPLQAQDIVFISTADLVHWNRAINQVLPTLQTSWLTYSMVRDH